MFRCDIMNRHYRLLSACFCFVCLGMLSDGPEAYTLVRVNNVNVYYDSSAAVLLYESGLMIDADGSPFAYHPVSDSGSDALANAGRKGNWWGIVTDSKGNPVLQHANDPAPGFYVSTTSLQNKFYALIDPRRYVNSDSIPFFVLPSNKDILRFAHLGDIARVENKRNGKVSFAIFADVGPKDKIGEGSIYLANQLNINANPRKGGIEDSIHYTIYIGSGDGLCKSKKQIDSIGVAFATNTNLRHR